MTFVIGIIKNLLGRTVFLKFINHEFIKELSLRKKTMVILIKINWMFFSCSSFRRQFGNDLPLFIFT